MAADGIARVTDEDAQDEVCQRLRNVKDAGDFATVHLHSRRPIARRVARRTVVVTIEIHAMVPDGIPDSVVRPVSENARTLKLEHWGFEEE